MAVLNKPGTDLEWCNLNPTDGTSGQPAIINPSGGKKDSGFLRLEEPPRQDLNWFQNLAGLWSSYFEEFTDRSPIANASIYGMDPSNTGAQNNTALISALAVSLNVYIPPGIYLMEGNITFADGVNILGNRSGTQLHFSGASIWSLQDKRTRFYSIGFYGTDGDPLTIDTTHLFIGVTVFELCFFDSTVLDLIDMESGNPNGLIIMKECSVIGGSIFKNTVASTSCPTLLVDNSLFSSPGNPTSIDFLGTSISMKSFDNCVFDGSNFEISGSGTIIENSTFKDGNTITLTGTDSLIVRNNIEVAGSIAVVANATSRAFFYNNQNENGIISDVTEAIDGVRFYGEDNSTACPDGVQTKINFSTNRTVSMARIPVYGKDVVEDGTGIFTYRGIGKNRTKIHCFIPFSVAATPDLECFLVINGTNAREFTKNDSQFTTSYFTLDTEVTFSIGDTFTIEVLNNTGSSVSTGPNLNGIINHIEIEGF